MAKTDFYLTFVPTFSGNGERVLSIAASNLTKKRPNSGGRTGSVSVRMTVEIPDSAFLPLRPQAIVVVPESMAQVNEPIISVEATEQQ